MRWYRVFTPSVPTDRGRLIFDMGEIEMIESPMDVLSLFPIRKSKQQKEAFIDAVAEYARNANYPVTVETEKRRVRNIVIGDPENAKYLITAHYDTPPSIGLPNLIAPNNPFIFFGIQLFLVALLMAVAVTVGFCAIWLGAEEKIALLIAYVLYMGMLLLMLKGPANRHNANDNTSGVVTALEIMTALPETRRSEVCFVFFDLEEAGLVGSKAYRNRHKAATEIQVVLNMDCVGDGDVIQLTPVNKAKADSVLTENLSTICGFVGQKELRLRTKGFYKGNSDHKNFPKGVAIMAFRYKKGIGLYCGRIHTWRDKILDRENVAILKDKLLEFLSADTNGK